LLTDRDRAAGRTVFVSQHQAADLVPGEPEWRLAESIAPGAGDASIAPRDGMSCWPNATLTALSGPISTSGDATGALAAASSLGWPPSLTSTPSAVPSSAVGMAWRWSKTGTPLQLHQPVPSSASRPSSSSA